MQFDMDLFVKIIAIAIPFLLALLAGAWGLTKLAGNQFSRRVDEQFGVLTKAIGENKEATKAGIESLRTELNNHRTSLDNRLNHLSDQTRSLERDLLVLKGDLPNHYERRDDAIRREVTIISRLDRIAEKIRDKDA